ncbi:MAG TPA: hypothetical protein VNF00_06075 [Candidatus Acidoferrales bacterium]|nr:hypothetical protein [Candidatus Acidoferrales bacterium]
MAEKRESARTTIILSLVTVAVAAYALLFGLQTLIYFEAHHWASATPTLNEIPRPLPSTVASTPEEKDLSFYGYQFAAPWKGITKQNPENDRSEIDFKSGAALVFFNPEGEKNIVDSIRTGDPKTYARYQAVFGTNLFANDYALYLAVYSASPAAISPFMSRDEAVRISTLLQWKLAFGSDGTKSIYTLQAGDNRGLQFGDPARDHIVVVRLFDSHGQQVRLLFTSKSPQTGTFSQANINCVVDSIRPAASLQ